MIESSHSLYKLMILYMMESVDFPLTVSQICDFMIGEGFTSYFQVQNALSEMLDSDLITEKAITHITYYRISARGEETLRFFNNEIPAGVKDDIRSFMKKHAYRMRSEYAATAEYQWTSENGYVAHCMIREGGATLLDMRFSVPSEDAARTLCNNWRRKNAEAYSALMNLLL